MKPIVALDTETHKVQPGILAPPMVCLSVFKPGVKEVWLGPGGPDADPSLLREALAHFRKWLQSDHIIVGLSIAYDMAVYLAHCPEDFELVWQKYEREEVYDIGVAAMLCAIEEGRLRERTLFTRSGEALKGNRYSLKDVVKEWLFRDDAKKNDRFRLSYALLENLPVNQWPLDAQQYPIDDVENSYLVAELQMKEGAIENNHLTPFQSQVAFCMHIGAVNGIRADLGRTEKFAADVLKRQEELKNRFIECGIYRYEGPKKEPQRKLVQKKKVLQEFVTNAYGGQPPTSKGGGVSCDRVTLEDSGDPLLESLAEVGKLDTMVRYIEPLKQASVSPLNVEPNVLLATGRSSYKGVIQLMPRKGGIRDCVRGVGTLCSVDYAAVELSTLAQVCINMGIKSHLADAINDDLDPHVVLASKLKGQSYDDFMMLMKAEATKAEYKDIRQAGKAGNFGFPGMMGPIKFVIAKRKEGASVCEWLYRDGRCGEEKVREWHGQDCTRPMCLRCIEESAKIKHFYAKEAWLEMPEYWSVISNMLDSDDSHIQYGSHMKRGGLSGPSAANDYFQGLAAWCAKHAVRRLTEEMYLGRMPGSTKLSPLKGCRLYVFAHDETILDIPRYFSDEQRHEAAYRQRDVMLEPMKKYVKDVKVKAEPALMPYWYKDAEAVFDAKGLLIPWEPKEKKAA